jgi:hypothetical protein
MSALNNPVMVLNKMWMPIRVITVKRAFVLAFANRASIVLPDDYSVYDWEKWCKIPPAEGEQSILTATSAVKIPEVIVLLRYDKLHTRGVRLTKRNIFLRDGHICQYTGKQVKASEADIDHIIPKSRGGKSAWDNMVVCSKDVNRRKADRTPEEAGLQLIRKPSKPAATRLLFDPKKGCPASWDKFLSHVR